MFFIIRIQPGMFINNRILLATIECLQKCMQCNTNPSVKCLVAKNAKGFISECQSCKQKRKHCTVLRKKPSIQRGSMVLYAGGSWDHLAVKLQVKIKSAEMVPDDTGDKGKGSSLVPVAGEDNVKAKAKMPVTGILLSQIQWGCSVYDPKTPNKKIGSIKVLPQQPGEETGICLHLLGLFDAADWFPVMVSIEKLTEEVVLELERLHTELQTLENDQELERELKQLGAFLVFKNQVSTSSMDKKKGMALWSHSFAVTKKWKVACL